MEDKLVVGDCDPIIVDVKRALGFFTVNDLFDEELAQRIRGVQLTYDLEVTGVLDGETVERVMSK